MKFLIILFISSLFFCLAPEVYSQEIPQGYEFVDSVVYRPVSAVDTTLAGKDIFHILPSEKAGDPADVKVTQSQDIKDSMRKQISSNSTRTLSGYRVRIFFDNKQTSRVESENTLKRFKSLYPAVPAYRIYANPYFKVTVGDFRTKSDAMALLVDIKASFPSAFVVKENIEYPVVDSENAIVADTVKVLRPIMN